MPLVRNNHLLTSTRGEDTTKGIMNIGRALNNGCRSQKGAEPAELRTTQSLQPGRSLRQVGAELISDGGPSLCALDARQVLGDGLGSSCEVLDDRDRRNVATIRTFEKTLHEGLVDVSEQFFNGLILLDRPLRGYRSLEDANTLRILIEDGFNVFGSPQGVLNSQNW